MPRIKIDISKTELVHQINTLEANQTFRNRSDLYQALANTDWAKAKKITPSVIYLRVKEFNLTPKTPQGKRGNPGLKGNTNRQPRIPRAEKLKKFKKSFDMMRANAVRAKALWALPIIDKAEQGSLKAAVKVNCIQCSSFNRAEIRNCQVFDCGTYPVRAYQNKSEIGTDIPEDEQTDNALEIIALEEENLVQAC